MRWLFLCFVYLLYEKAYNNRTTGQKGAPLGDGAGCVRILMMPEGIIAVGLTGGDSTGIAAAAGGVDGTAPMVLTRQRQCHPGPAGFGWRGIGAPAPEQNASFAILVYSRISGNG